MQHLNEVHKVNVPFILMNSFNTDDETQRIIQKYANHNIQILTFNQSRFPRVGKESLLPIPRNATSNKSEWYPPGHGDIFDALNNSGLLDKLIEAGKEYMFVSNVDNLGADVDLKILKVCRTASLINFTKGLTCCSFYSTWSTLRPSSSWSLLTRRRRTSRVVLLLTTRAQSGFSRLRKSPPNTLRTSSRSGSSSTSTPTPSTSTCRYVAVQQVLFKHVRTDHLRSGTLGFEACHGDGGHGA